MKRIITIVQEHLFSKKEIRALEAGIKSIYQKNYSNEDVKMIWMVMPKGYAYSERKLSNAVVMMMEVENNTEQSKREQLLFAVSKFLLDNFSISPLDSVITAPDASYIDAFSKAQQNRIDAKYRPFINLKIMGKIFWSKITDGFLKLPIRV